MSITQPDITNPISTWKSAIIGSFIMVGISAAAAVYHPAKELLVELYEEGK